MHKNIKTIIKNNKNTIIISAIASALTVFILVATLFALIATKTVSLGDYFGTQSTNQPLGKPISTGTAAEESSVINAVKKANPAVVSIIITKDVPIYEQHYQSNPFYFDLFGNNNSSQQNETEEQEVGGGSGFFVSSDGYIVTNNHVIEDTTAEYTVMTNDGKKYSAKILASDSVFDVAILKVEGKGFSYLSFANSDNLELGQTAIAIGNALAEFQNSISMGIVSGLSRSITAGDSSGNSEQLEGIIQTDAAINPGNSGGPLLDIKGNVIGVNVAVQNGAENIGFALPSNMVKGIAESVIQYGEIVKPYIGVRYTQITEAVKEKNNLSVDYGVLVARGESSDELAVIPGSPADKAGIVENDIILEIDGIKLDEDKSLVSIIRQKQIGQTVELKILHDGQTKNIQAKLERYPKDL